MLPTIAITVAILASVGSISLYFWGDEAKKDFNLILALLFILLAGQVHTENKIHEVHESVVYEVPK